MTDKELPVHAYLQLEDFDWEDVNDLPGAEKDCLGDFAEMTINVVVGHFRNACENLWPLLEGIQFQSISIGIDVVGLERGMAGYYHEASERNDGHYGFSVSRNVLKEYLSHHLDQNISLSIHTSHMWEHEIIHMCDHKNLVEFRYNKSSTDVREFLIQFLLSFRNEGLADLLYLMTGNCIIKSLDEAQTGFRKAIARFNAIEWEDGSLIRQRQYEVMQTYDFYSIGPWAILHVLSHPGYRGLTPRVNSDVRNMTNGKIPEGNQMVELVRDALKITNYDFIRLITEPGINGMPFIEKSILNCLASRLSAIKHPREIAVTDGEYNRANADLTNFFYRLWPE